MGPGSDEGHKRDSSLRCRNFGLKSLWKRIEVTQRVERKVKPLDLRPQATKQIGDPPCEGWITSKQNLHAHGWCWQPSLLEDPVKSGSYLCICTGAFDGLMKKRRGRGPKGQ